MKALVTGATGLLGNNLVRLLLDDGVEGRAMSSSANRSRSLRRLDVERFEADVRDHDAVTRATEGVNAVFHCAGAVNIGWSRRTEHKSINYVGTKNVADALRGRDIRLVHVSSVNALGIAWPDRVADEDDFDPRITPCPYVASKRAGQEYIARQVADENLDAVTVIPSFFLGPWDWKPSSGQLVLSIARQYSPWYPTGGVSLADVRDVARGTLSAFRHGESGRRYILAGHNLSYREIWRLVAECSGAREPILPLGPVNRALGGGASNLVHWLTGREPVVNSVVLKMSAMRHYFCSKRASDELGYETRPAAQIVRDAFQWLIEYHCQPVPGNPVPAYARMAWPPYAG